MSRWLSFAGREAIETAPITTVPVSPPILTLVVSVGAVASEITYASGTFEPDYDCIIQMAMGQSVGAVAKPLKPGCLVATQGPGLTGTSFDSELAAVFGPLCIGMRAFAEVHRQREDGHRSAGFAIASNVVA
jgi:hypothetical protein